MICENCYGIIHEEEKYFTKVHSIERELEDKVEVLESITENILCLDCVRALGKLSDFDEN